MDLSEIFDVQLNTKLSKSPEILRSFPGVIQIEIDDEAWHLNPNHEEQPIRSGKSSESECQISISKSDFEKLLRNELNIPLALAFRKIKVQGNPVYLAKLKDLFK